MALYIHPENQTVIWTAFCGTPLFAAWAAPAGEKARVFREKVGEVYDSRARFQSDPTRLSAQELGQMNRAAIASIAAHVQALRAARSDQVRRAPAPLEGPANSPVNGALMRDFDGRAREYDTMRAPPAPKDIQFADDVAEGPIENMDELVQRCLRERDADLHAHAAPPLTIDPRASDASLSGVVALDAEPPFASLEPPSARPPQLEKSVRWDTSAAALRPPTIIIGSDARDKDRYADVCARMDALSEQMAQLSRESAAAIAESAAVIAEMAARMDVILAALSEGRLNTESSVISLAEPGSS